MPYIVKQVEQEYCVYKETAEGSGIPDGDALACHANETDARNHQKALYANVDDIDREKHSGAIVMFNLPEDVKNKLAMLDGEPAEDLHMTLIYIPNLKSIDKDTLELRLRSFLSGELPLAVRINGIARFVTKSDKDALVALVDGVTLADFRTRMFQALGLDYAEQNYGFIPHITLKYIEKSSVSGVEIDSDFNFTLSNVVFAWEGENVAQVEIKRGLMNIGKSVLNAIKDLIPKDRSIRAGDVFNTVIKHCQGNNELVLDMFFGEGIGPYVVLARDGKLYRREIQVKDDVVQLGELVDIPLGEDNTARTRTKIIREANGRYRWFSISGVAALNRVGEIDSRELYDSFIEHAERTGQYPIRMFWHLGASFRTGQCDYLARDENCYITSGLYDENNILAEIEIAAREQEPERYGESNGFTATEAPDMTEIAQGVYVPVYKRGIHKEISTLLENRAASVLTLTT